MLCLALIVLIQIVHARENKTPLITRTFVICNPEREPDRCHHSRSQLHELDFGFTSFIWKDQLRDNVLKKYHVPTDLTQVTSLVVTSLTLNHLFILEHIKNNYAAGSFMIFESDIVLEKNFTHHLNNIMMEWQERELDIDMLYLGRCMGNIIHESERTNGYYLYKKDKTMCTDSMIWSYKGIVKLFDFFATYPRITEAVDFFFDNFRISGNNTQVYWASPSIVLQGSINGLFPSWTG